MMEEDASGMKRPRSREEPGDEPPQPRKRAAKPKAKPNAGSKAGKLKAAPKSAHDGREQKKPAASDQLNFPEKLMQLINESMAPDHVTWIESEEAISFKTDRFQEEVLDKFFQGLKYDSFVRKLNRWGFRRVTSEGIVAGTVAYYHNSFRKEEQELLKTMGIGKKNDPEVRDLQAFGGETSMIGSASAAISREAQSRSEASVAGASVQTARTQLDRHVLGAAMSRQQALDHLITGSAIAAARVASPQGQETKTDVPHNVLAQAGPDAQQLLLEAVLSRQREADAAALHEREAAALVENILFQQAQQQRRANAAALLANSRDDDFVRKLAALAANSSSRQPPQQPPPPAPNQFSPPQQQLQLSDLASNPALALFLQQHLQGSNQGVNQGINQNPAAGTNIFAPNLNPVANLAANVNIPQGRIVNPNIQANLNPLTNVVANANTNNQGSQDFESLLRLLMQNRQRDAQQREGDQRPPNP